MKADGVVNRKGTGSAARPGGRRELITIVALMSLVVLAFFGLGWRCYYLQCCRGELYSGKCMDQQRALLPLEPQRGAILDCQGRVLAASNQIRTVFAEPRIITDPKETASRLALAVNLPAHEICQTITSAGNPGYVPLLKDATADQCEAARRIPGIGIHYSWQRHYPTGPLASHVVGFTSADNRGLAGIEFEFDRRLRGRSTRHSFFVDVHRRPIGLCVDDEQDGGIVTNGAGIILTLDATIQQFAREELIEQYQAYEAEGAMSAVVDARSGAVLAMVSLPDFDPTKAGHTDPKRFYNRVLTDQFEPGSIIKPIVMAIALDTGAVSRNTTIFCENGNYRGRGFGRIGEYRHGFGDLTVREILVNSSNIGMAKVGQRLGPARLYEGLTLFGFGRPVGIKLPGEAAGLLWPPSEWTGYSVTRIPFGQEISVTAFQMLRAFCMLASGGRLVQPHLIKAVVEPDGTMKDIRPSPLRVGYVIKRDVADWVVRTALTDVVNEGTGKRAKLEQWQVFGKTGTAQIARSDGPGYEHRAYIASFVCGAPADDPRVVVLVSVRRPNVSLGKGYTGGTVAAPVASAILKKTLQYLEVPPRTQPTVAADSARASVARAAW